LLEPLLTLSTQGYNCTTEDNLWQLARKEGCQV